MVVQHNLTAMNANRQLGVVTGSQGKIAERLSSGYKINRAGDDAAGLKISEKMRSQIRGLNKASDNAQDGVSLIQTAEGALNEAHSILQRMNELTVQGANDTNTDIDRDAINQELTALTTELDRIASTTQFNKQNLLNGDFTGKKLQVGANKNQYIAISINQMNATAIGIKGSATVKYMSTGYSYDGTKCITQASAAGLLSAAKDAVNSVAGRVTNNTSNISYDSKTFTVLSANDTTVDGVSKFSTNATALAYVNGLASAARQASIEALGNVGTYDLATSTIVTEPTVSNFDKAQITLSRIQAAIDNVSQQRSALGALQNRLEHTIANLDNVAENTQAAESRIRDTDMAESMVEYSKNQILAQAGQSMLAQANQATQGVLSLLQ